MIRKLLEILVCPKCKSELGAVPDQDEVLEGTLKCVQCAASYSITNGIPRFVQTENYASSFGFQWNLFKRTQLDSYNGTTLSADRFWSETKLRRGDMAGKWVLDGGCGAGRFLDVVSRSECDVVGIDISNAVDAARDNLEKRKNVHLVQASIYELPFRDDTFDVCYSIGVIQHTPEPARSLRALAAVTGAGGRLALTIYPRKRYTKLNAKYLLRPLTRRISGERMLSILKGILPVVFPVTSILFRLPLLGKVFQFTVPIANYVNEPQLSREERYKWALLDTFDMLTPQYDQPMNEAEAKDAMSSYDLEYVVCDADGLNIVAQKKKGG